MELYLAGKVSWENALAMATSAHEFKLMVTQRRGGEESDLDNDTFSGSFLTRH